MRNKKRRFIEHLGLSAIIALNLSGLPHTRTVLYARLWHWKGEPWSISALAHATGIDRSTVRDHIRKFPDEHLVWTDKGILLTPEGERASYFMTKCYYRAIPPKQRQFIKTFFSTNYAGQHPYRKQSEFFVDLDRCNRRVTTSFVVRAVLTAMDLQSSKVERWTISELSKGTAFSYQAVHKIMPVLVAQGFVSQKGKTFSITKKGKLRCLMFFFEAVRRADMRLLKILFAMTVFKSD
jgi:predicted transcriptional regulator